MPNPSFGTVFKTAPGLIIAAALTLTSAACSANADVTKSSPAASLPVASVSAKSAIEGSISLSADLSKISTGMAFDVRVTVGTMDVLRGAQWSLKFDPALMKCESFEEGSFFKKWAETNQANTLLFPQPAIDNQAGTVSDAGIALMGGTDSGAAVDGAAGQGVLGIYHFTALSDNLKLPELQNTRVADVRGNMFDIKIK